MVGIIRKNIETLGNKISASVQGSALYGALFVFLLTFFYTDSAFALFDISFQKDASGIASNIVSGTALFPKLLASLSYLIGLALGVSGILKVKEHVDQPTQTPIRTGVIRLLIGGAMFSLPIVTVSMVSLITGGGTGSFDNTIFSPVGLFSGLLGKISGVIGAVGLTQDFNSVLSAVLHSLRNIPALVTAAAYMLGLVLGVQGLLKIKDHVENPDQNPLKEGIIRLLIGGAFIAIPAIFTAMAVLITGGAQTTGIAGAVSGFFKALGTLESSYDVRGCTGDALGGVIDGSLVSELTNDGENYSGNSMGSTLCNIIGHTGSFPAFLTAISYLFGLVLGFIALLKARDHVLNPQNTPLSQAISRFVAGGAFFSLPMIIEVVRASVTPVSTTIGDALGAISGEGNSAISEAGYNAGGASCGGNDSEGFTAALSNIWSGLTGDGTEAEGGGAVASAGLDGRLYCAVTDILGPLHVLLNFFTLSAGIILIMIGISRLLKSEQDGARGPGGIGTFMTFLTGGLLISFSDMIRFMTTTLFSTDKTATFATLQYADGLGTSEMAHAHMVFSAILKFMIMIGLISFARGLFIIRGVAEGDNQSSLMAGMTHIIGGALAVNLGPLMNAVQVTLGITGYGVTFS